MSETSKMADIAARWVARLASGEASPGEVAELRRWLSIEPEHQRAFDRARRTWAHLAPLEGVARQSLRSRRTAIAAVLAAAACFAFAVVGHRILAHDFVSSIGEVRNVTLPDGSTAWLDSGAAVDFDRRDGTRVLSIARGRVHVAVAAGQRAPFIVKADGTVIRDIGTAFTVDTESDSLIVDVREGEVAIERNGSKTSVTAGHSARLPRHGQALTAISDARAESAWRNNRILLDRVKLADALKIAARYRRGKVMLLDDHVSGQLVSGALSIDHLDESLDALAAGHGLRLRRLPLLLIVTSG